MTDSSKEEFIDHLKLLSDYHEQAANSIDIATNGLADGAGLAKEYLTSK